MAKIKRYMDVEIEKIQNSDLSEKILTKIKLNTSSKWLGKRDNSWYYYKEFHDAVNSLITTKDKSIKGHEVFWDAETGILQITKAGSSHTSHAKTVMGVKKKEEKKRIRMMVPPNCYKAASGNGCLVFLDHALALNESDQLPKGVYDSDGFYYPSLDHYISLREYRSKYQETVPVKGPGFSVDNYNVRFKSWKEAIEYDEKE